MPCFLLIGQVLTSIFLILVDFLSGFARLLQSLACCKHTVQYLCVLAWTLGQSPVTVHPAYFGPRCITEGGVEALFPVPESK